MGRRNGPDRCGKDYSVRQVEQIDRLAWKLFLRDGNVRVYLGPHRARAVRRNSGGDRMSNPGGFIWRDGKPGQKATTAAELDRVVRELNEELERGGHVERINAKEKEVNGRKKGTRLSADYLRLCDEHPTLAVKALAVSREHGYELGSVARSIYQAISDAAREAAADPANMLNDGERLICAAMDIRPADFVRANFPGLIRQPETEGGAE